MKLQLAEFASHPAETARWSARLLVIAWAAFWIWFNVAAGIGERAEFGWNALLNHLVLATLVLVPAALAWFRDLPGGLALITVAAIFAIRFHSPLWLGVQWMVPILLVVPPALAGAILLSLSIRRLS